MLDLFCIVDDVGGHVSKQEQMVEIGVDCGDVVVLRRRKEDRDLVEGEDQELKVEEDGERH